MELSNGQLMTSNGRYYVVCIFKRDDSYGNQYELTSLNKISKKRFEKLQHISDLKHDVVHAVSEPEVKE